MTCLHNRAPCLSAPSSQTPSTDALSVGATSRATEAQVEAAARLLTARLSSPEYGVSGSRGEANAMGQAARRAAGGRCACLRRLSRIGRSVSLASLRSWPSRKPHSASSWSSSARTSIARSRRASCCFTCSRDQPSLSAATDHRACAQRTGGRADGRQHEARARRAVRRSACGHCRKRQVAWPANRRAACAVARGSRAARARRPKRRVAARSAAS